MPGARAPRWRGTGRSAPEAPEPGSPAPGDGLVVLSEAGQPTIPVYGAPRPAVPQRLPLTPRFGCASGAGVGLGAAAGGFRRLPEWLKVRLPGSGEYAETKSLLRRQRLHTVCEE